MTKRDMLENPAKSIYLGIGSNLGNRKKNRDWSRDKARYIRKSS